MTGMIYLAPHTGHVMHNTLHAQSCTRRGAFRMLLPMLQKEGVLEEDELSFEFRRQRFVYLPDSNKFEKLRFPDKVCRSSCWPALNMASVCIMEHAACIKQCIRHAACIVQCRP